MTRGKYKRTDRIRKALSESHKGKRLSKKHKHNLSISHIGLKQSAETIKKRIDKIKGRKKIFKNPILRGIRISKALKGRIMSSEEKQIRKDVFSNPVIRKKISDAQILNSKMNPNSGMKGKHHSNIAKIKMSKSKIGSTHTEKTKNKISINNARGFLGKTHSDKSKKLMSNITEKEREKRRKRMKEMHKSGKIILPVKDTTIEVKIQNFLKKLNIEYFTHQYMHIEHGYQCDILIPKQETEGILIPQKTIIECDGDYWHNYPIGKDIDHLRTSELLSEGFKVLRLWEREIRIMEIDDFKEKLR